VFAVSRYMGTSLAMIDLHYGHRASDGRQHAVALLDALAREKAVDAGWTPPSPPTKPAQQHAWRRATQGALTLAWTLGGRRAQNATRERSRKEALSMEEAKPSDGLEPSTPSLPSEAVAVGCQRLPIGLFEPFSGSSHLPPVATGCARLDPYRAALR